MVVVEGATLATFVTGSITMLIIGILLNVVGLGIFCWALFMLAIHALPFFVGMTAGIYSFQAGAGPFGAIVAGFVPGGSTLVARAVRIFRRALSHCRPCHWAAIRGSGGLRRLRCDPRALPMWVFPRNGGGSRSLSRRHRRRVHRLGAHVDLDEPALRGGVAPVPAQPPIGAATKGR